MSRDHDRRMPIVTAELGEQIRGDVLTALPQSSVRSGVRSSEVGYAPRPDWSGAIYQPALEPDARELVEPAG
jgi:hypothetical protein